MEWDLGFNSIQELELKPEAASSKLFVGEARTRVRLD